MVEGEKETRNMADATLRRFDFLLKQCSLYSQSGQLISWKNCLMDLRRNLFPFMEKKDFDGVNTKFNSLPNGWLAPNGNISSDNFAEVNKIFDEIYMIFITIMKKKGLLMPKPIDAGKAVIEM